MFSIPNALEVGFTPFFFKKKGGITLEHLCINAQAGFPHLFKR